MGNLSKWKRILISVLNLKKNIFYNITFLQIPF
jgi:hypothetical protein